MQASDIREFFISVWDIIESAWDVISYPSKQLDEYATFFFELMNQYGLDPLYLCTFFMNLIAVSYWNDYKRWDKKHSKRMHWFEIKSMELVLVTIVGSIALTALSIMHLIGIFGP